MSGAIDLGNEVPVLELRDLAFPEIIPPLLGGDEVYVYVCSVCRVSVAVLTPTNSH